MKQKLGRERLYLYSPFAVSVTKVEIEGHVYIALLKDAIIEAVRKNEILNARVVITKKGEAYFENQFFETNPNETVKIYKDFDWREVVKEQERIPFDFEQGEFVRFFFLQNAGKQELVIMAHRLLGDGASIAFLIEDIMCSLEDQKIMTKMYKRPKRIKKQEKQTFMKRLHIKYICNQWEREGSSFSKDEYDKLYRDVWFKTASYIQCETLYAETLLRIGSYAKREGVMIGSVILTAFSKASRELRQMLPKESTDDRIARANEMLDMNEIQKLLRPDKFLLEISSNREYKGIGDHAISKPFTYLYDSDISFSENVKKLDMQVRTADYGQEEIIVEMFPKSMTDSIHFQLAGFYMSPETEWFIKELGYDPDGVSTAVTNLAKVPIPIKYKNLSLKNYLYVPPIHPGARRTIGIAIFGNAMNICLHAKTDDYLANAKLFFRDGIDILKDIN